MPKKLKGKVALSTGGSAGIGLATAVRSVTRAWSKKGFARTGQLAAMNAARQQPFHA